MNYKKTDRGELCRKYVRSDGTGSFANHIYKIEIFKLPNYISIRIEFTNNLGELDINIEIENGKLIIHEDDLFIYTISEKFNDLLFEKLPLLTSDDFDNIMLPAIMKILSPLINLATRIQNEMDGFEDSCTRGMIKRA